ncbi:10777_t:CDS:2 [Scutellospora calospora]|uniref:10777_t:CDS:1 n=1 Tax=Scutellospora calospora TaxID=85575 RepID=A0ACA9JUD7_9GLOM|nr:10777_t:CDS:2 [Scutellospora calospora]
MNEITSILQSIFSNNNFSNEIKDDQPIDFVIHEDTNQTQHNFGNITPSMNLSEVRKLLENLENVYMGENMVFLKENIKTQIHPDKEKNLNVLKILAHDNCIHIMKYPTKPSSFQFVNKYNLLHGCYFTSDGYIKRAKNKAFKFKNKIVAKIDMNNPYLKDDRIEYAEEIDQMFIKNPYMKINATIPLPWPLPSLKFGINIESSSEKWRQTTGSYRYEVFDCAKCSMNIPRNEIEPTEEFKDAIKKVLEQQTYEERLNAIKALSQEFGFFFPMFTEFGGRIQCRVELNSETSANSKKENFEVNLQDFSSSYNSKKGSSTSICNVISSCKIIGGDETDPDIRDRKSRQKWTETLRTCDKWRPINYSEIISVYDMLDNKLRAQFLEGFGQEVLLSGIVEVRFNSKDIVEPQTRKIENIPSNILANMENNQIYATVYNDKSIHKVFSAHVVYYHNKSASLVIQCIKTKEVEELKEQKFNHVVKVAWMIVGFRTDFSFEPSLNLKLNSYTLKKPIQKFYNKPKCTENAERCPSKIKFPSHKRYCLLGTCAFRYQSTDEVDEDSESGVIIGLHFCQNKHNWDPCVYAFDLNKGRQVDIYTKPLEIHWGIITTEQEYKEMIWDNSNKYLMYKGQEWKDYSIEGNIQKLFFSLLCKDCFPVFTNVSPEYPTMHLFEEQNAESRK